LFLTFSEILLTFLKFLPVHTVAWCVGSVILCCPSVRPSVRLVWRWDYRWVSEGHTMGDFTFWLVR